MSEPVSSRAAVSFSAGKTASSSSSSSTSIKTGGAEDWFRCGNVVLVSETFDPLATQVAIHVARGMTNLPGVNRVETIYATKQGLPSPIIPAGGVAPDLFIRISLKSREETGVINQSRKVKLETTMGSKPWASNHSSVDDTSVPGIQFIWKSELDHSSEFTGISSSRVTQLGAELGEQVFKSISNEFCKLQREHAPGVDVPGWMTPRFKAAPEFPGLQQLKAQLMFSHCGLLVVNESWWRFSAGGDKPAAFRGLRDSLLSAGWKLNSESLTNTGALRLEMKNETGTVEVFPESYDFQSLPERRNAPENFIVWYREPVSLTDREAMLGRLLDEPVSTSTLLTFDSKFYGPMRNRFLERLEKGGDVSVRGLLAVAEARLNRKQTNAAVESVLQAASLLYELEDSSSARRRVVEFGKKLKMGKHIPETNAPPGAVDLRDVKLPNQEFKRPLGSPLRLTLSDGKDGVVKVSWIVRIPDPKSGTVQFIGLEQRHGALSRSSMSADSGKSSHYSQSVMLPERAGSLSMTVSGKDRDVLFLVTPASR
ncbi:MAG TPA: hypothetical protein VK968_16845 [Roseimicrobium sp.]|nr:hypothetical protein [Roseimicrobium sp.]